MSEVIKFPGASKEKITYEETMMACMVAMAEGVTTLAAWADRDGMSRGFWNDEDKDEDEVTARNEN